MDILQNLQNMLGQAASGSTDNRAHAGADDGLGGLGGLLNSNVLGGLANVLLGGKSGGSPASGSLGAGSGAGGGALAGGLGSLLGSLLSGGGASIFGGQADQVAKANPDMSQYSTNRGAVASTPQEKAGRVIRAMVYAAKADGHVDDKEQAAITDQLRKFNVGSQGQSLVNQAMNEPLDPNNIARGLKDPQEAVQLYVLSCVLTNADQFMERNYLDALATALGIPADVKSSIEAKIRGR